jgi:hypothetical protein
VTPRSRESLTSGSAISAAPRFGVQSLPHAADELVHIGEVALDPVDMLGDLLQSPSKHSSLQPRVT